MTPYLSIIIPAYNESKRLPLTLIDVDKKLSEANFSYEIIVVNDGSKDNTAEIVRRFSHLIKNLHLVDNKENHGKGWVVRQGMLEANGKIRLFMDADNSTTVDQFNNMAPYFAKRYDMVIGSRDIKGAHLEPAQAWYKRFLGNIGNLIIQVVLLRGIWDTQCGFKAMTAEAAEKIFSKATIDRWGFDVEMLALAKLFNYKIKEIPVVWKNDLFSHVKPSTYLQVLIEVFKIKWRIITSRYMVKP